MRKLVFLFAISIFLIACSPDDYRSSDFFLEIMPVESVRLPDQFVSGKSYEVEMTFIAPNSCYESNDFSIQADGNVRTIAVIATAFASSNCIESTEEVIVSLDFTITEVGVYVFKFYQGLDKNGKDQFYEVEIPVIE